MKIEYLCVSMVSMHIAYVYILITNFKNRKSNKFLTEKKKVDERA